MPENEFLPYFKFYPRDWLASPTVATMSAAERGAFIQLLSLAWVDDGLPADDHERLARYCGCTAAELRLVLGEFPAAPDGRLRNPKQESLRVEARDYSASQAAKGKRSAELRSSRGSAADEQRMSRCSTAAEQRLNSGQPLQTSDAEADTVPSGLAAPAAPARLAVRDSSSRKPSGDHQEFIDWWCRAFEAATGSSYGFQGKKDGRHVQRILARPGGSQEARKRASILLASAPEWIASGGVDLGTLDSQWNKLASAGNVGVSSGTKQLALRGMNGHSSSSLPSDVAAFLAPTPKALPR